jgi:hypothetical protein
MPDGLSLSWGPVNYINPPYSKSQWQKWVKKAFDEMLKGKKNNNAAAVKNWHKGVS